MFTKQIFIPSKHIPLSIPFLHGKEWKYIKECLDTGWVSSAGKYVEIFERRISRYNRIPYTVACTSGTAALQMALLSVGIKPDDEVIVPTVTFIATVNVVSYHRAQPVFMDCDDFYNIDVLKTIEFIQKETSFRKGVSYNKKTKKRISAIIPVHAFGNAVDLARLVPICKERNIKVIEDATESLGTFYTSGVFKNRFTGTIGDIGCFSFNGNKIITTGGGGMIATHQAAYARQARYYTTQAKDNRTYYIHNAIGYNFRLNNMQAALGVAQLENLPHVIKIKSRNYQQYKEGINDIEGLTVADAPGYARNNLWMYALQIDTKKYGRTRDELLKIFSKEDVELRPLWHLNHLQKPYRKYQAYRIQKAPQMLAKTLNLPCSVGLKKEEISRVIMLLKKWKRKT